MSAKLLIVDDDIDFASQLASVMHPHGWLVEMTHTGGDALQLLQNFKYDFVLLDFNLPQLTGIEICRQFRALGGETPIIFLTGRQTVDDKEEGLDAGGDDYITKPFDVRELLARIRAVQRRRGRPSSGRRSLRDVGLDSKLRRAFFNNAEAQLSLKECSILEFLFDNPGKYFTSKQLLDAVWTSDSDTSEEAVRVHMKSLRRKLAGIGCAELIKTVLGAGYIIEIDDGAR